MLGAGVAGAQLVVADDQLATVLGDGRPHDGELVVGQGLVEQHAGRRAHDPPGGPHDEDGHHDGQHGVEERAARHLDQHEAAGHGQRGVDVGQVVGGVGSQGGRVGAPGRASEVGGEADVDRRRDEHHGDGEGNVVECLPGDQMLHGLDHDRHGRREDDPPLDDAGEVLDLLVSVEVPAIGRTRRLAHRHEGDHGGHQIGGRVDRLGDDADRAREHPDGELEGDQHAVGPDRHPRGVRL